MPEATSNVEFAQKIHEEGHHRPPSTSRQAQWVEIAEAVVLAIVGFFATAVAGYLTGLVGASNNPVSGVTVIVLLALALVLKLLGVSPGVGPRLAIMAGAVVCTAAAMAGDSMHDLATGYHVGATPRALEIAVLIGAIASAFIVAPVLNLLLNAYGIAGTAGAKAMRSRRRRRS